MVVPGIVLELKFTDRFPNWMRQMVQTFNLFRTSMAKYVTCAMAMTPDGLEMIRQNEAVRRMAAAQRWERQRRATDEAAAPSRPPAPISEPPPAAPALAAGRVGL